VSAGGFHWKHEGGVPILIPDFFSDLGLAGGFSARADDEGRDLDFDLRGGKPRGKITENRRRVSAAMEIDPSRLVFAEQIHGAEAAVVTAQDAPRGATDHSEAVAGVDALVTAAPAVALAGLSADCPLVLIAAENRRAVAAVHSGWRGTAAGIAARAVQALNDFGAPPQTLFAAVGPGIGPCCYEVGPEVRDAFPAHLAAAEGVLVERAGSLFLDLPRAIRHQLLDCGLVPDRISAAAYCTSCENETFFSYRREGAAAGRCAGVIAIRG